MAKAQRIPEGDTVVLEPEPLTETRAAALLEPWEPILLMSIHMEQEMRSGKRN